MATISEGRSQVPFSTLVSRVGGSNSTFFFQASKIEVTPITRKKRIKGIPIQRWNFRRNRRRFTLELVGDSIIDTTRTTDKSIQIRKVGKLLKNQKELVELFLKWKNLPKNQGQKKGAKAPI
jgi:hypothetical protein